MSGPILTNPEIGFESLRLLDEITQYHCVGFSKGFRIPGQYDYHGFWRSPDATRASIVTAWKGRRLLLAVKFQAGLQEHIAICESEIPEDDMKLVPWEFGQRFLAPMIANLANQIETAGRITNGN